MGKKARFKTSSKSRRSVRSDGWKFTMDKGWKKYGDAHEIRKFQRKLQRHRKRAFDAIARSIVKEVINNSSSFKSNAPLTLLLKSGSRPLSDTGRNLFKAIGTQVLSKDKLFVGLLRTNKFYAQAKLIHDGGTIAVTEKMRNMFYILWLVSKGDMDPSKLTGRAAELWGMNQTWYPLAETTKAIKIPSRPFMEEVFRNKKVIEMARLEFRKAVNKTLKDMVGR